MSLTTSADLASESTAKQRAGIMQKNASGVTRVIPPKRSMARAVWRIGSLLSMAAWCLALAAAPREVGREVDHLLLYIEQSGCDFYRNGSWYDGRRASAHLRLKYEYLSQRHEIASAEDFIEKAATRSSLTSQLYKVRCAPGAAGPTSPWLFEELAHYRASMASPPATGMPSPGPMQDSVRPPSG